MSEDTILSPDELGPIDHLVVEFDSGSVGGEGFAALLDLAERGVIFLLDLEFVARGADGSAQIVDVESLPDPDGVLAPFAGSASGLLDPADLAAIGEQLAPGTVAAVAVFEHLDVATLTTGMARGGGRVISHNRVSTKALLAALDRVETLPETETVDRLSIAPSNA